MEYNPIRCVPTAAMVTVECRRRSRAALNIVFEGLEPTHSWGGSEKEAVALNQWETLWTALLPEVQQVVTTLPKGRRQ